MERRGLPRKPQDSVRLWSRLWKGPPDDKRPGRRARRRQPATHGCGDYTSTDWRLQQPDHARRGTGWASPALPPPTLCAPGTTTLPNRICHVGAGVSAGPGRARWPAPRPVMITLPAHYPARPGGGRGARPCAPTLAMHHYLAWLLRAFRSSSSFFNSSPKPAQSPAFSLSMAWL